MTSIKTNVLWASKLLIITWILSLIQKWNWLSSWPNSTSSYPAYTTVKDNFVGSSITKIYGVKLGPKSYSLYYSYFSIVQEYTVLRRIDSNDTLVWMAAFA